MAAVKTSQQSAGGIEETPPRHPWPSNASAARPHAHGHDNPRSYRKHEVRAKEYSSSLFGTPRRSRALVSERGAAPRQPRLRQRPEVQTTLVSERKQRILSDDTTPNTHDQRNQLAAAAAQMAH